MYPSARSTADPGRGQPAPGQPSHRAWREPADQGQLAQTIGGPEWTELGLFCSDRTPRVIRFRRAPENVHAGVLLEVVLVFSGAGGGRQYEELVRCDGGLLDHGWLTMCCYCSIGRRVCCAGWGTINIFRRSAFGAVGLGV